MKLLAAILFTAVLLFNLIGYQLLTGYWQRQQNTTLEAKLDGQQYNEADLITLKMPVRLPYYTNSATFERVDGEITLDGVLYKYVKRRVYNDSIELLCIPNHTKMQLQRASNDYFKWNNDLQNGTQNKKPSTVQVKTVGFDYCQPLTTYTFAAPSPLQQPHSVTQSPALSTAFVCSPEQPPELI